MVVIVVKTPPVGGDKIFKNVNFSLKFFIKWWKKVKIDQLAKL